MISLNGVQKRTFVPLVFSVVATGVLLVASSGEVPWLNGLDVAKWPAVRLLAGNGEAVHHALLLGSAVLVFLNTLLFQMDLLETATKFPDRASEGLRKALGLTFLSLGVVFAWGVLIIFWTRESQESLRPLEHHSHDVIAIVLFLLFIWIDWCLIAGGSKRERVILEELQTRRRMLKAAYGDNDETSIKQTKVECEELARLHVVQPVEQLSIKAQLWMVDVPVVAGLLAVLVLLEMPLKHSGVISIGFAKTFSDGFGAGAVAMHIVTSQVIFIIISTWRQKEKDKLVKGMAPERAHDPGYPVGE